MYITVVSPSVLMLVLQLVLPVIYISIISNVSTNGSIVISISLSTFYGP